MAGMPCGCRTWGPPTRRSSIGPAATRRRRRRSAAWPRRSPPTRPNAAATCRRCADCCAAQAVQARELDALLAAQPDLGAVPAAGVGPALQGWQQARERLSAPQRRAAPAGRRRRRRRAAARDARRAGRGRTGTRRRAAAVGQPAPGGRGQPRRPAARDGAGPAGADRAAAAAGLSSSSSRRRAPCGRQAARLRDQAGELQRMALVAEHTAALVIVTDRDDRLLWANEAFSRVAGWSLAEATGRQPAQLLASPHADADVLARVQQGHPGRPRRRASSGCTGRATGATSGSTSTSARCTTAAGGCRASCALPPTSPAACSSRASCRRCGRGCRPASWCRPPDGAFVEANRAAERLLGMSLAELQGCGPDAPGLQPLREDGSDYPVGRAARRCARWPAAGRCATRPWACARRRANCAGCSSTPSRCSMRRARRRASSRASPTSPKAGC